MCLLPFLCVAVTSQKGPDTHRVAVLVGKNSILCGGGLVICHVFVVGKV